MLPVIATDALISPIFQTNLIIKQHQAMRIKDTSTVYSYSISVCMGSFVFGYELSSFGNLKNLILEQNFSGDAGDSNAFLLLSTLLALSAILGIGIYRYLIKAVGYAQTFKLTDYLTIIAAVFGMLNLSVGAQAISRILFGIVAGINTIIVPTYLTSVLPGSMGGPAGTLNQWFITLGIFFGFWMGYLVVDGTAADVGWKILVGLPIIPALIRLYTSQNVYPYESVESMIETGDDERLQHYLDLMYEDITLQQFKQAKALPLVDIEAEEATLLDPAGESYRKRLLVGVGIVFFNQLSGGAALGSFGGNVAFHSVTKENDPEGVLTVFVYLNLLQVIVTLITGQLLEKYGRRAFMMEGQRIIIVSLLLIAFIEIFVPQLHVFTVILTFIQMIGFSLSYGPCSFLILTEILHDIWVGSVALWVFIFIHGVSVWPFIQTIGVGPLCLIYLAFQIWGLMFVSGSLVETQGRARADVYEQFRTSMFPNPIRYLKEKLKLPAKKKADRSDIELGLIDSSK